MNFKAGFLFLILIVSTVPCRAYNLNSQQGNLQLISGPFGFEVRLDAQNRSFEQKLPLAIEVVSDDGATRWLEGAYRKVRAGHGDLDCYGHLESEQGTQFIFHDKYARDGEGFRLSRQVKIETPSSKDIGFSSRFGLGWSTSIGAQDGEVLMPGVWYRDNKTVPPKAFGADASKQVLMIREDRLGLPLVAFRDPKDGVSLEMERVDGRPTTIAGDSGGQRLIDQRLQFGAIGFLNTGHLQTTFSFPGSEDERPVMGPESPVGNRYLPRSHPVKIGVPHFYVLHFEVRKTNKFADLVEQTTEAAIERAHPPLFRADLKQVYSSSIGLLGTVTQNYNGTVAVPFQVGVPDGKVKDTSSQMGFVGMALPCAALLLKDGLKRNDQDAIDRAEKVVDFWAANAQQPSGVPKNWADFPALGRVTWRAFPTHLRVACDGMEGVIQAWKVESTYGRNRPNWLQFARSFGDLLVKSQNSDGSWFGKWNFDGTPHDQFTNATTHPIAFLLDLSRATGDESYRLCAMRAGEFCWRTVHQAYSYVGGTPDNPNVTDKEAGMMAVNAFMALYDATGDSKWLSGAKQAALFCETWIYWRDLPVPEDVEKRVFPMGRSNVGLSLISTGQSGADNFMAIAPFDWYRIYLATGDRHFLVTARLLLHDTKQIIDWNGRLNYKYPGLMPEAMSLSTNRGRGVSGWLPWLSFVVLEPLVELKDAFGSMDIDRIERLPMAKRLALSKKWGESGGFDVIKSQK